MKFILPLEHIDLKDNDIDTIEVLKPSQNNVSGINITDLIQNVDLEVENIPKNILVEKNRWVFDSPLCY